jgi:hypothetical protein
VPPRAGSTTPTQRPAHPAQPAVDPTRVEPSAKKRSGWRRRPKAAEPPPAPPKTEPTPPPPIDPALAPPGYHIYRPSSATSGNGKDPGDT